MDRRIEGIVVSTASGSAGGAQWDLIVFLCPWREAGGDVQRRQLRLLVAMSDRASASAAMTEWNGGRAVALTLRSLEPPSEKLPWGLAYGQPPLTPLEPDAALRAVIDDLAQPRRVHDPVLGELLLDRRIGCYEGTRRSGGATYDVAVQTRDPDDDRRVADAVARGGDVMLRLEAELAPIVDAITDDKIDLYNSTWRENRPVLSRDAFRERVTLTSVVISDARTTAYFECGDLFFDHIIEVRLSPDDGRISEICLVG
jgi:hypothetical protein